MASPAGDRTEKPTAKRLRDARERGQVARSHDLAAAISLMGATLMLGWMGPTILQAVMARLASGLVAADEAARMTFEGPTLAREVWSAGGFLALVAGPAIGVAAALSVGGSVLQVGWSFAPKALTLNWSRLSPATGLKRFGPMRAVPELTKALLGITALSVLAWVSMRPFLERSAMLTAMTPLEAAGYGWQQAWSLLWRASLLLAALAAADFAWQRWRWTSDLRMTHQEVRDESRLQEGSPELKARVRRVQREMSRRRMLQAVKTATVVVTNPTHVAVALEYRRHEMAAPIVVAKGQDLLAARIRKVAAANGVPLVENVPLARALYSSVDVGDAIPAGLFGAVAEMLAYLVRLKQLIL